MKDIHAALHSGDEETVKTAHAVKTSDYVQLNDREKLSLVIGNKSRLTGTDHLSLCVLLQIKKFSCDTFLLNFRSVKNIER